MKLPKLPKFELPKKMLYNQVVLYALVLVALLQMVFYVQNQDPSSIIIMVLIGFLAAFFSKNMIVILTITIVFSAIISMKIPRTEEREGFENDEKNKKLSDKQKAKLNKKKEKEEAVEKEEDTTQEVEEALQLLKSEYPEFLQAQNDILEKIKEIDPILERAENFANKFEEYSKKTM
jgi:mannitol-specific phosphotransferase system IIBC component